MLRPLRVSWVFFLASGTAEGVVSSVLATSGSTAVSPRGSKHPSQSDSESLVQVPHSRQSHCPDAEPGLLQQLVAQAVPAGPMRSFGLEGGEVGRAVSRRPTQGLRFFVDKLFAISSSHASQKKLRSKPA